MAEVGIVEHLARGELGHTCCEDKGREGKESEEGRKGKEGREGREGEEGGWVRN